MAALAGRRALSRFHPVVPKECTAIGGLFGELLLGRTYHGSTGDDVQSHRQAQPPKPTDAPRAQSSSSRDGLSTRARQMSTAEASAGRQRPPAKAATWRQFQHFPITLGVDLKVEVGGATRVDLRASDKEVKGEWESIFLMAEWHGPGASENSKGQFFAFKSDPQERIVEIKVRDPESAQVPPDVLTLSIPQRWVWVDVTTEEGDVDVRHVNEGNLSVATKGANVRLGYVKSESCSVRTGGGSLTARTIYAPLRLDTGGGCVDVKKLLGNDVSIAAGGGAVTLGAYYGREISVQAGSFSSQSFKADAGKVDVRGGEVKVGSLDGSVTIESHGGDVELQLQEDAKEVEVRSGAGNVLLFAPAGLSMEISYEGEGAMVAELGREGGPRAEGGGGAAAPGGGRAGPQRLSVTGRADPGQEPNHHSLAQELVSPAAGGPGGGGGGGGVAHEKRCNVRVYATTGGVRIVTRSWREATAARLGLPL